MLPESTDYWLWQTCFGATSFMARTAPSWRAGYLPASPGVPDEIYVDQVAVRRRGEGAA